MYVHSEQTKQVADLSTQSSLKKVESALLSCALLVQKYLFEHIGHTSECPLTSTVCGSLLLNSFIWSCVCFQYLNVSLSSILFTVICLGNYSRCCKIANFEGKFFLQVRLLLLIKCKHMKQPLNLLSIISLNKHKILMNPCIRGLYLLRSV